MEKQQARIIRLALDIDARLEALEQELKALRQGQAETQAQIRQVITLLTEEK
jgi:hypothetical protein